MAINKLLLCVTLWACLFLSIHAENCPDGWIRFHESCYFFADEVNMDWTEATHYCTAHHQGYLVTIESAPEEMFLRDQAHHLFKINGNQAASSFWVGASDEEIEGVWTWYTNNVSLTDGYNNWHPGEPDHSGNCAVLWGPFQFGFGDWFCDHKLHIICEKNSSDEGSEIVG